MSIKEVKSHSNLEEVTGWIVDSQNGNVRAFEFLYREFHQRLFLFCRRMTGDISAAEELVQESYIKAWQALPEFRAESVFYTWLRKIASRLVIDRFRLKQQKVWQNTVEFEEMDFSKKLSIEYKMDLEKLISFLPNGARSILVLHEIEGYGHKEIAEMLDIAEGTSKAQLARAKKLLKKHFKNSEEQSKQA